MSDMPVEPEIEADEGLHTKEVYARYGLAMYYAQVLEHQVVNFVVIFNLDAQRKAKQKITPEDVDALFEVHFEKTLGRLIHTVKGLMTTPPDLEADLKDVLTKRNWLAHDFFRERAGEFMTQTGRRQMIAEADGCREAFHKTDKVIFEMTRPMREVVGMTDEALEREYQAMLGEIKQKAGEA